MGAAGGVVMVSMVCVVNMPGTLIVHLGTKVDGEGRAASALE